MVTMRRCYGIEVTKKALQDIQGEKEKEEFHYQRLISLRLPLHSQIHLWTEVDARERLIFIDVGQMNTDL